MCYWLGKIKQYFVINHDFIKVLIKLRLQFNIRFHILQIIYYQITTRNKSFTPASMKKLKVFYAKRLTNDLDKNDTVNLMNVEINNDIAKWIKKEKIGNYDIVNSQFVTTPEINLFGQFYASQLLLSIHIIYG